ncbi:MAG: ribosome modulation factor [Marinobacter sp.]|nr:ribosome modulation factor [Marinobacter sp.]
MTTDINLGWEVDTLNKAYRQGHMAASMGMTRERCPYRGDVVIAAWEAGWEDATEAAQEEAANRDLLSRIA